MDAVRVTKRKKDTPGVPWFTGLFTRPQSAAYLGISARHALNLEKLKFAPNWYGAKLLAMGNAVVLPVEDPPPACIIGETQHRAILALQQGDPREAEALTAKVMRFGRDWDATEKARETPPFQLLFARAINAMAWAQHPVHATTAQEGLPKFAALRRDLEDFIEREKILDSHPHWSAVCYLRVTVRSYEMATFVAKLGVGCFLHCPDLAARRAAANKAVNKAGDIRRPIAKRLLRRVMPKIRREAAVYERFPVISLRLAWNVAQLAAVADEDEDFVRAYEAIGARFAGPLSNVEQVLWDDPDTRRMLSKTHLRAKLNLPPT